MSVRDVQLYMIAGRVRSVIRAGVRADEAIAWALMEPHDVITLRRPEHGRGPEFVRWEGVRIASEDAGLFRALVAECRLEADLLPPVETMIARARARLKPAPGPAAAHSDGEGVSPPVW